MKDKKGLINRNGKLYRHGKEYLAYGVNYYSLLTDYLVYDIDYKKGIDTLSDNLIPYVRFNCGVYYPTEINLLEKKGADCIKKIADYAEKKGLGLIPSLFWHCFCIPDYFDEPLNSWGISKTSTYKYMIEYTTKIVNILKNYDCVFCWEFGNEFNLELDLPNRMDNIPPLTSNSKREARDENDQLKTKSVSNAYKIFGELIHTIDKDKRIISSGNAILRASQFNQAQTLTWKHDNETEHKTITNELTPPPLDCISEHIYFNKHDYLGNNNMCVEDYLQHAYNLAKNLKKILLIGEFGDCGFNENTIENEFYGYKKMCEIMKKIGIPLALAWNYDPQERTEFSFGNDNKKQKYIFKTLQEINH